MGAWRVGGHERATHDGVRRASLDPGRGGSGMKYLEAFLAQATASVSPHVEGDAGMADKTAKRSPDPLLSVSSGALECLSTARGLTPVVADGMARPACDGCRRTDWTVTVVMDDGRR